MQKQIAVDAPRAEAMRIRVNIRNVITLVKVFRKKKNFLHWQFKKKNQKNLNTAGA